MAITNKNRSLEGVADILRESALAISGFRALALVGAKAQDILISDIEDLKRKEDALLAKFGGMEGLKKRIEKFKADAANFAGRGLLLNFTLPYEMMLDTELKKQQEDFEIYFLKQVELISKEIPSLALEGVDAQKLYDFLNLKEEFYSLENLKGIITDKGTTLKGMRRSGGQVGKQENQKLSELLVKNMSTPIRDRLEAAVKRIKKEMKEQGIDIKVYEKINKNQIQIYAGTEWFKLTSHGGVPLTETEARNNKAISKKLKTINQKISNQIRTQLGNPDGFDSIINQMLSQNEYMFFVGKNVNQITGLIGEITAMILFKDLVGSYPSPQWAAQNRGLKGTQDSADIIIREGYGIEVEDPTKDFDKLNQLGQGYGIQVKNTTKDFGKLKQQGEGLEIGFSEVSLERLGQNLGFDSLPIENLYDAMNYNIGYGWRKKEGEKGNTFFASDANSQFSGMAENIKTLIEMFEDTMLAYSAALLYMNKTRTSQKTFYSGDIGNVLYMISLVPYRASDMLQEIVNSIKDFNRKMPINFTTGFKDKKKDEDTIVDDINEGPHAFFSSAGTEMTFSDRKRYFKTSYTFY